MFHRLTSWLHKGSLRLFRVAGIDVSLHWTWLIAAFFAFRGGVTQYASPVWHAVEYVALFGIVLLHEFGHVLACRQVGGTANKIVLWPLGGIALVSPPPRPGALLWTIAAGPLVNLILVPITLALAVASAHVGGEQRAPDFAQFLLAIALLNFALLVFNLLPICPLDGGQILHALLWFVIGRVPSLVVVTPIGLIAGISVAILAFWLREWWSVLLGFFVIIGSLAGMGSARILLRIGNAPRREDQVCPSCGKAAPVGNFWKCERCFTLVDVFAAGSRCSKCGSLMGDIQCLDCGQRHVLYDWYPESEVRQIEQPPVVAGSAKSMVMTGEGTAEQSENAARHYRKAFALLPRTSGAEMRILQHALTTPLDGMTFDLIERGEPALQELHQGAMLEFCNWELDSPKQLQELIDLVVPVRRLCDLGWLRARQEFREHEGQAALEGFADLLVLARHYSQIGLALMRFLQSTVELFTTEIAAANLLEQDAGNLQAFAARLANLPKVGTLAEMMEKEKLYVKHVIRPQFEGKNNQEALALVCRGVSASDADAMWKAAGQKAAGVLTSIDAAAQLLDEVGSVLMLPENRVEAALAEFMKQHQSTSPSAAIAVRHILSILFPITRGRVRLEMLQAAVAIAATGNWREAARDHSWTEPFECRCFKTRFELKSTSGFRDQPPVTLFVGKRRRLPELLRRFFGQA